MVKVFSRPNYKWTGQVVNLCEVPQLGVSDAGR